MIKFVSEQPVAVNLVRTEEILSQIRNDPLGGWLDLPTNPNPEELSAIKAATTKIQGDSKYLVCIGIGGSYLGHRALIEAMAPSSPTQILYAGNNISAREFNKLLEVLGSQDFSINIISKSGTTLEPAIAFRLLKALLIQKYGQDGARSRIYVTTDQHGGALFNEATQEQYTRFVVPDNLGGRYSVLSAVGLLPLAVAGVDIEALLHGAAEEAKLTNMLHLADVPAIKYATSRAALASEGKDVEVLASFEPSLFYFGEWWKQLFGESEGKNGQGIFPATSTYTTDLHSLGQYMQAGRRNIFETMLEFEQLPDTDFVIPSSDQNLDGLNYLASKTFNYINTKAREATVAAHREGGLAVFEVIAPDFSADSFGALVYFFELACAVSAKLQNLNPFDQPGVDAYKTKMFGLLGRPGYEIL